MKSKILPITIGLALILLLAGGTTWYFLPSIIVKAVTSEGAIQVIPKEVKATINEKFDKLPQALVQSDLGITIDDIIEVLDKSTSEQIIATINQLESMELKNQQQVLDIVLQNVNLYKLDNEKTRKVILENMKMSDVKSAMKMIRENGKPYLLTIPVAKETVKGILIEKRDKIEKRLNNSTASSLK